MERKDIGYFDSPDSAKEGSSTADAIEPEPPRARREPRGCVAGVRVAPDISSLQGFRC
jgi:hypothetical protein